MSGTLRARWPAGTFVEAAKQVGLEVPRGTRALWGRSQGLAIGAYRNWLKRKA